MAAMSQLGFRLAFWCTTPQATDAVLGQGWVSQGLQRLDNRSGRPWRRVPSGRRRATRQAADLLLDDTAIVQVASHAVSGRSSRLLTT
jgi:hypothetical protein